MPSSAERFQIFLSRLLCKAEVPPGTSKTPGSGAPARAVHRPSLLYSVLVWNLQADSSTMKSNESNEHTSRNQNTVFFTYLQSTSCFLRCLPYDSPGHLPNTGWGLQGQHLGMVSARRHPPPLLALNCSPMNSERRFNELLGKIIEHLQFLIL